MHSCSVQGLRKTFSCLPLSELDGNERTLSLCKSNLEVFPNTLSLAFHRRLPWQCSHGNSFLFHLRSPVVGSQKNQMWTISDTVQCPMGNTGGWHKTGTCRLHCPVLWGPGGLCENCLPEPYFSEGHGEVSVSLHINEARNYCQKSLNIIYTKCWFSCWRALKCVF